MKSPHTYWVGMGDYAECITPDDKRFDPNMKSIAEWVELDNIAECERRYLRNLLSPIRKKCLGLLYGNHEDDMRRHFKGNFHQNLCDDLEVTNLGYSCFLRLFFNRLNSAETHILTGCLTHGSGNAQTDGGKINKLQKFMNDFEADWYGYAHTHALKTDEKPHLRISASKFGEARIKSRDRVGALTGSWFRTHTQGIIASYGERRAYSPTNIGCVMFEFDLDEQYINIEVHKSK
jgi:hypothetical protein